MANEDAIRGKTVPSKIIRVDNQHVIPGLTLRASLDSASVFGQAAEYLSQAGHLFGAMEVH